MKQARRRRGHLPNPYLEAFTLLCGSSKSVNMPSIDRMLQHIDTYASRFEARTNLVSRFAWAIPNDAAIRAIARYSPIVEMGAGTGYWARCLTEAGAEVTCYDQSPGQNDQAWHPVMAGQPPVLVNHREAALLLCWPPYNSSMAYQAVKFHGGRILCYVGEGPGGCTGDEAFHEYVGNHYEEVESIAIPQYDGLRDALFIYQRKIRRI